MGWCGIIHSENFSSPIPDVLVDNRFLFSITNAVFVVDLTNVGMIVQNTIDVRFIPCFGMVAQNTIDVRFIPCFPLLGSNPVFVEFLSNQRGRLDFNEPLMLFRSIIVCGVIITRSAALFPNQESGWQTVSTASRPAS